MDSLSEIQKYADTKKGWIKFGSKLGDPFLSILNDQIKKDISQIEYESGKSYQFTDGKYYYKIQPIQDGDKMRFNFFIKSKNNVIYDDLPKQIIEKKQQPNNTVYLLFGILAFIIIEIIILFLFGVFSL